MKRKLEESMLVYQIKNDIYFSDYITKNSTKDLKNILSKLTNEYDEYNIIVDSPGGSVTHGIQIYHDIKKSKHKINTIATGLVGGIAILILLAGNKKSITLFGTLWLGEISSCNNESYLDMMSRVKYLEKLQETVDNIILDNTNKKMTPTKLNIFRSDNYFLRSDEAIKYGFADEKVEK